MRSSDGSGNLTSRVNSRGSRISFSIGSRNSIEALSGLDDYLAAHAGAVVEEAAEEIRARLARDQRRRTLTGRKVARAPKSWPDVAACAQRIVGPARIVDERRRVE